LTRVKRQVAKTPLATSKAIFENCDLANVSRKTRCKALKEVAQVKKAESRPPLTKLHKEKRLKWAKDYMKSNFASVIFTNECRATLDGPDGWAQGWVSKGQDAPHRYKRQQGGGGVMFWAGIVSDELVGPCRVADCVKINSEGYCGFLQEDFIPWWKKQPLH